MVLLRWLGWLWIASGVAAAVLGLGDSGLIDGRIDPEAIARLVGGVAAGVVPGLILVAISLRGRRRPRGQGRYFEHARRNEAELARVMAKQKPSKAQLRAQLAAEAAMEPETASAPATRVATVAAERPAPRRQSVIER